MIEKNKEKWSILLFAGIIQLAATPVKKRVALLLSLPRNLMAYECYIPVYTI